MPEDLTPTDSPSLQGWTPSAPHTWRKEFHTAQGHISGEIVEQAPADYLVRFQVLDAADPAQDGSAAEFYDLSSLPEAIEVGESAVQDLPITTFEIYSISPGDWWDHLGDQ